jgi:hypothetical protein
MIALRDNDNGTLSIESDIIEQSSPPRPGKRARSRDRLLSPREVIRLASIARELSFNAPKPRTARTGRATGGALRSIATSSSSSRTLTESLEIDNAALTPAQFT